MNQYDLGFADAILAGKPNSMLTVAMEHLREEYWQGVRDAFVGDRLYESTADHTPSTLDPAAEAGYAIAEFFRDIGR